MKRELNPDHHRSEPLTSVLSKPLTEEELSTDLRRITVSHCRTQYVEKVCELSKVDGNIEEKPHADCKQPGRIHAVPIHRRPDLLVPCADLVNSEWQRSQAARVHSLQKSCPEFPVCLVLLQGHRETERLLGHVRLSHVVGHSGSLFVESVVVSKVERGKGYGRTLMEETERYAKSRGYRRLCLTTHDKQHFYAHLGYVLSTPVQSAGAMTSFVPMEMLLRFSRMPSVEMNMRKPTLMAAQIPQGNRDSQGSSVVGSLLSSSQPPSPISMLPSQPPPSSISMLPPPFSSVPAPLPPPTPIIPPPPPPPPQSAGQLVVQTLTETPYRDAKGTPIYWMHKDI
uniref:N-alpha-acetyltransferase 80 n=1 Tax=Solea senegalensis TaxID=28829 RepID=UPI001CD8F9ED|nr:N-alpha-acetyltransferase 80 [Solea senegalensis]